MKITNFDPLHLYAAKPAITLYHGLVYMATRNNTSDDIY